MKRAAAWIMVVAGLLALASLALKGPDRVPSALLAGTDGRPLDSAQRGAIAFYGADFGGLSLAALESHAVPWRLVAAALLLDARDADPAVRLDPAALAAVMARFGFLSPAAIGNWPAGVPAIRSALQLGFTHGDLPLVRGLPVRVANLGCAACHAGVMWRADGTPDPSRAWLGTPNSSLDLEAYTQAVFRAMRRQTRDPDRLLAAAATLFPDMGSGERLALRHLVLPRVRDRLAALAGQDRPLPFPNGTPGSTNGIAALKMALGVPLAGGGAGEVGFVSIPDLGHRTWRSSLLADGAYAVPGAARNAPTTIADLTPAHADAQAAITTFFTVPSMGVHPDRAIDSLPAARDVTAFLARYSPQRFPGPIDRAAAAAGRRLYAARCAACHGGYDGSLDAPRLLRFPNWIGLVGTDPLRARLLDARLAAAVAASPYRDKVAPASTGRYAAPPLTGLWASAPYLHNGSVPTLAALLDPATRPVRFKVGGHALDFAAVGLRITATGDYPPGYRPWSTPAWIDTRLPGKGAGGHDQGSDLSAIEKRQLIEYLKLL